MHSAHASMTTNRRKMILLAFEEGFDTSLHEMISPQWEIYPASNVSSAREMIERHDLRVGLVMLDEKFLNQRHPELENFLMVTGQVQWVGLTRPVFLEKTAVRRLIAEYLYDYHTLPADSLRLLNTLGHADGMAYINQSISHPVSVQARGYEMVGTSPAMQEVFQAIGKIASVDAQVTITGESGTGKELAARAIHERSSRSKEPFIAVNCGALPANLIQSELFGHEKGAFTGAHQRKTGRIEAAHGGTIFLDEIGDLPIDLQVNLLRFLQESTIERIGGTETIPVDVRIIAATHMDLKKAVKEGRFREDLYYRIDVLRLKLPPLRERKDDIEPLSRFYFDKFSRERGRHIKGFSQQALQAMTSYDWPGNIRELINRIRRAVVMCESRLIGPIDLGFDESQDNQNTMTLEQARSEADKRTIQLCLHHTRNNISEAARRLNISRVTLYRLMEKHGLLPHKVERKPSGANAQNDPLKTKNQGTSDVKNQISPIKTHYLSNKLSSDNDNEPKNYKNYHLLKSDRSVVHGGDSRRGHGIDVKSDSGMEAERNPRLPSRSRFFR